MRCTSSIWNSPVANPERIVACPNCGKSTPYSSKNSYRPFCSERCRLIDLGDWASEAHAIPGRELPPGALDEDGKQEY